MENQRLLDGIDAGDALDFLAATIRFKSYSGEPGETELARFMVEHMQSLGLDAALQPVEAERFNAIGTLKGTGGGKSLLFNGHMDTNPATEGWTVDPWGGLYDEDFIYGIAVALVTGRASLTEFEDRWIRDVEVRDLMARVTMTVDPGRDDNAQPSVSIETTGGERLEGHEPIGLGDPLNPLTTEQVVAKYTDLARRALPSDAAATLRDAVFGLPAPDSMARLLASLRLPG